MVMFATTGAYSLVTLSAYIFLNSTAASLIVVTLLPLATVPVLLKSSLSIRVSDEANLSNEQSNHVRTYIHMCIYVVKAYTYVHTYIHTYVHTYIHTYVCR